MRNLRAKGFSLFEAMLSTAIMSVIAVLLFNMSSTFFSTMSAQGSKRDETKKFIKIYTNINKTLSASNADYFYSYSNEGFSPNYRWFFYPSPYDSKGVCQASQTKIYWTRIYLWFLKRPDGDTCSDQYHDNPDKDKICCPHKRLTRLCYEYNGPQDNSIICEVLNQFCDYWKSRMGSGDMGKIPEEIKVKLDNGEENLLKLSENTVVADNILDLRILENKKAADDEEDVMYDSSVKFELTAIKISEAKKKTEIGSKDLKNSKYAEKEIWSIRPVN